MKPSHFYESNTISPFSTGMHFYLEFGYDWTILLRLGSVYGEYSLF
ncbi:hypothetical protein E2C01_095493 [Portunus trituberculatus]|uniref:Uncharacterized protein n=1 Tax=Portunus trituberculatus TaxID=210409 RepID=A0A5B7K5X3_PORTR|nr:hypothetical protein [Portunus trituberculatus]